MSDKGLKSMSRGELLELLIAQMEENENLRKQLKMAEEQLQNRRINIEKAGSIAEASLLLNGVFQSAEEAAKQYLENIRIVSEKQQGMEAAARQKADAIIAEAESYSNRLQSETKLYCKELIQKTQAVCKAQDARYRMNLKDN